MVELNPSQGRLESGNNILKQKDGIPALIENVAWNPKILVQDKPYLVVLSSSDRYGKSFR
jgi:hypothetical protein